MPAPKRGRAGAIEPMPVPGVPRPAEAADGGGKRPVRTLRFDGAEAGHATDAWEGLIRDVFGDVDLVIPDRSAFAGALRSAAVGPVEVNTVECSYEDARRTRAQAGRSEAASLALAFVRRGELALEQGGRACTVAAGGFVLFDLSAPYAHRHAGWTDVLSIKLPRAMLEARLGGVQGRLVQPGTAARGIGRVAHDALAALAAEAGALEARSLDECAARIVDLLALALDAGAAPDLPAVEAPARVQVYRRMLAFIDAHLHDCDLDAAAIAAAQRVSVRYLHQVFQDQGRTVGEVIRTRRLERCRRELAAAGERATAVKDVALRAGFRSPSHFATAFRRAYGLSPTDLRQGLP